VSAAEGPAGEAAATGNGGGARRPWHSSDASSPGGSGPMAIRRMARGFFAPIQRILGFGVMRASASFRNRSGEPIRARAWLESASIEEHYGYSQEISLNADVRRVGKPDGEIKLVLPYDGDKYFTRQAHRDVAGARHRGASAADKAVVGFLGLTGYEKTGLEGPLGLHANFGSVPIEVWLPDPVQTGEADQLLTDASACVISEKYLPEEPKIVPVHIDIEIDDPDTAESSGVVRRSRPTVDGFSDLAARAQARARLIRQSPERQLDFKPDLWFRMTVRLHLPRAQKDDVIAEVSKVFMSWPTHTSLSSLTLHTDGNAQLRYNPEEEHDDHKGGLEWSGVSMEVEDVTSEAEVSASAEDEIVTLSSGEMTLSISKPGDLYKKVALSGRVEVTMNHLLSGMDARLYDATGKQCRSWRPDLKLKSVVTTEFSMSLYDAFARRTMSPYQWLYFDEVIPSEMRIDDIMMALTNRGFRVSDAHGDIPKSCFITADLAHGPDKLQLALYVRGTRYKARRERIVPGGMTYRTSVGSGELRIYVYGSLRAESKPVIREINALRRALRERFDRLPAGR
jgi:hypothetical protein